MLATFQVIAMISRPPPLEDSIGAYMFTQVSVLSVFAGLIFLVDWRREAEKRLKELTPPLRTVWLSEPLGFTRPTVNRELQQLKAMLNFAIQNDWLILNPFAKCKGIISTALETKRDRVLSYEEEERLLKACTGRRAHLRAIVICALDTGMRRGEIFQMKWKDVDLSGGQIYIPQTNTKTQTARTVGITPRLKQELLRLWERSPKYPEWIVFGISADVKNAWKSALQEADIENFRFHDCRHTATTRMIASGCHHTEVMKITGHSQMVTFLRYLNITPETAQRVRTAWELTCPTASRCSMMCR